MINEIIKKFAKALSEGNPNSNLFEVAEGIETTMLREKNMFANLDWYSAVSIVVHYGASIAEGL